MKNLMSIAFITLSTLGLSVPSYSEELKPGCKEVTTTRETGYNIGVVHDKVSVTEREVVCKDSPAKDPAPKEAKPAKEPKDHNRKN